MNEQPIGLDTDLLLQSLKFLQMKIDSTKYSTYEERQSKLQRLNATSTQIRSGHLSSLDIALILEALENTRQNFEKTDYYPTAEFKQQQLQRVNDLIAQVRALPRV
ncbi:MAG: hypothetical protein IPO81_12660 [Kouleothrix sp.]|nr:hypothetical protein [Kouleothrix sp.]